MRLLHGTLDAAFAHMLVFADFGIDVVPLIISVRDMPSTKKATSTMAIRIRSMLYS